MRCGNDIDKVAELIENDYTGIVGIGNKHLCIVDVHAARVGELVGNAGAVGELVDYQAKIVIGIGNDDLIRGGVCYINIAERIDKHVLR